ncbi:phage tail tube protein [Carnobacterium antarcticum]|uniref:Phage tail tube protein n=1 Tax=Carnobacterium antarcticum TaxID=2126436 RepID=A0ABW4NNU2_9LACT|nr:phage tail tube protein [Carnobacterium sp. CP1]ALV20762.1 tail protein [Carnobacterium sp. CP1]
MKKQLLHSTGLKKMNIQLFADDPAGLLSKGTTLGYKPTGGGAGEYTTIDEVTSIPDIGSEPERVDVTTLADSNRKYIKGLQDQDNLTFAAVYRKTVFNTLKAAEKLDTVYDWKITYPDGTSFTFTGSFSTIYSGAEINGALAFSIVVVVSKGPDFVPAP